MDIIHSVGPTSPAFGLKLLTDRKHGMWQSIDNDAKHAVRLKLHPFDLDVPRASDWGPEEEINLILTGATDMTVDAMISHINYAVDDLEDRGVKRLRVILVEGNPGDNSKYFVYFEIWTRSGVYICGDCTNFSGGGGYGTRQMLSIFKLLELVHKKEIERAVIPYANARRYNDRLWSNHKNKLIR